jgi:hypothetical protein
MSLRHFIRIARHYNSFRSTIDNGTDDRCDDSHRVIEYPRQGQEVYSMHLLIDSRVNHRSLLRDLRHSIRTEIPKKETMVSPAVSKKQPEEPITTSITLTGKQRAVYCCKQCGLPAKGHVCAFRYQQQQGSSNMLSKPKTKSKTTMPKPHQQLLVRRKQPPHVEAKERKRKRLREHDQQEYQHQQEQDISNRTGRNAERDNDDNDDDESSFSTSSTEPDEGMARSRHAAPAHPQQQNNGKRQRSKQDTTSTNTEVLMAMHIFQDEVHAHRQEHDLFHTNNSNDNNDDSELKDQTDARFLTTWSRLATQQFTQQNLLVALNIELVAERRQLGKRVQKERNATVALRSKIRRVQAETKQVNQELAAIRQQKSTRRAASRFLNAVEQCRK